jgi:hypothetical protein
MFANRHFLSQKPRPRNAPYIRHTFVLGSPIQRLSGYLNDEPVIALPDSGAEPNIISYTYAKERGWLTRINDDSEHVVQFADGSLATTVGQIYTY